MIMKRQRMEKAEKTTEICEEIKKNGNFLKFKFAFCFIGRKMEWN
jgi:hypothetical protein